MAYKTRERPFPTRRYPYRAPGPGVAFAADPAAGVPPGSVVRFFLGRDTQALPLTETELAAAVADPFATQVLLSGHRPRTLRELLAIINGIHGVDALPVECVYRVADGGQIAWTPETEDLDRHLRIVITRGRGDDAEMLIATAPPFDSGDIFLQIFAWDPRLGAYNFYERREGIWAWAGSSWQALSPDMRGKGPFDSHVNGGPVMKELKLPWMHWHSQAAQIRDEILHPEDPVRHDPIYNSPNLKGAEDLELVMKAGIARWTRSRFDKSIDGGKLADARVFIRQVIDTTTINLTSAAQQSAALQPDELLRLPPTFFLNLDAFGNELGLTPEFGRPKAAADLYLAAVKRYRMKVGEGRFTFDGDTHFAFPVPEPAFEDLMVLRELLARGALSRRLATALLMVDFPNPIFSRRRASLLAYVPDNIVLNGGADLDVRFGSAVSAAPAAQTAGSAEAEFLELWAVPDPGWEAAAIARIEAYARRIHDRLATPEGFDGYFRLAESRRLEISGRPLLEFELTLPTAAGLPVTSPLRMTEAGDVVSVT